MLVLGVLNLSVPIPLLVIYPIFSIIWACGSWLVLPPRDGAMPKFNIVAGVLMGAFAGLFVAAPAFALFQDSTFDRGSARIQGYL